MQRASPAEIRQRSQPGCPGVRARIAPNENRSEGNFLTAVVAVTVDFQYGMAYLLLLSVLHLTRATAQVQEATTPDE